jgi:hypothetical protein
MKTGTVPFYLAKRVRIDTRERRTVVLRKR